MNVAEIVNNTIVQPKLLGEAMTLIAELPVEDRRSFEGRSIALIQKLDVDAANRSKVLMSITFRLEAMAQLAGTNDVRAWMVNGDEPEMSLVHPELVRCVAEEPLVETEDGYGLQFDPESFRERLLRLCEPRGNA